MRPAGDASVRSTAQARTVVTLLAWYYPFTAAMMLYRYSVPAACMRSFPIDSCAGWDVEAQIKKPLMKPRWKNPSLVDRGYPKGVGISLTALLAAASTPSRIGLYIF